MKIFSAGQTLIEVVVGIAVATFIIISLTNMTLSSYKNVSSSESQSNASSLAQQGIDFMRNLHDSNYALFTSYVPGTYCLDQATVKNNNALASCSPPAAIPTITVNNSTYTNIGSYQRIVDLKSNTSACTSVNSSQNVQVTVTVSWNDKSCSSTSSYCHNSQLTTCLSNSRIAANLGSGTLPIYISALYFHNAQATGTLPSGALGSWGTINSSAFGSNAKSMDNNLGTSVATAIAPAGTSTQYNLGAAQFVSAPLAAGNVFNSGQTFTTGLGINSTGTDNNDTAYEYVGVINSSGSKVADLYSTNYLSGIYGGQLVGNSLSLPTGICVVGSQVWVTNFGSSTISRFNMDGSPYSGSNQIITGNGLNDPSGCLVVGSQVWVPNYNASTISRFNPDGSVYSGGNLSGNGLTGSIGGLAIVGSQVWVPNYSGGTISRFNPDGTPACTSPCTISGNGLGSSYGIAVVGGSQVWVANDTDTPTISRFNPDGSIYSGGNLIGNSMSSPYDIAVVGGSQVWVTNGSGTYVNTISRFNTDGSIYSSGSLAGNGLNQPEDIAVVNNSQVWVANYNGATISRFNTDGTPYTGLTGYATAYSASPTFSNSYTTSQGDRLVVEVGGAKNVGGIYSSTNISFDGGMAVNANGVLNSAAGSFIAFNSPLQFFAPTPTPTLTPTPTITPTPTPTPTLTPTPTITPTPTPAPVSTNGGFLYMRLGITPQVSYLPSGFYSAWNLTQNSYAGG
ncbi:MAG TPA: hypothetical protein VMR41_01510, partial [Patescibacteria group bacterium]|nr:hypothetical protein [Patescibacteria group bacterium]